jgi:hypothetical protein
MDAMSKGSKDRDRAEILAALRANFEAEILRVANADRRREKIITEKFYEAHIQSDGAARRLKQECPDGLLACVREHASALADQLSCVAAAMGQFLLSPEVRDIVLRDEPLVRQWSWSRWSTELWLGVFDVQPKQRITRSQHLAYNTLQIADAFVDLHRPHYAWDSDLEALRRWLEPKADEVLSDSTPLTPRQWTRVIIGMLDRALAAQDPLRRYDELRFATPFALLFELEQFANARSKSSRRPNALPPTVPQPTYKEATTPARAFADGPSGRRWEPVSGEIALRHVIPGEPLQTKIVAGPSLDWWGIPATNESLRQELAQAGTDSVFVFYELLSMAATSSGQATVALDDLITVTWDRPRSTAERLERRRTVWRWLALFENTYVIGARRGTYTQRDSKKAVDTVSADPLFRVVGREYPVNSQLELDMSEPPLEVHIVPGRWLENFRGNRRMLSNFGDIRKIGAIPPGKPSGEWARCIGLALNQRWREMSSYAAVDRKGPDGKICVTYPETFTRRELLSFFPPKRTSLEEVLSGSNPKRAVEYWDEAVRLLKRAGVVGHYEEAAKLPNRRQGWQEAWLDQPLDIRPTREAEEATAEIAASAASARSVRSKRNAKRV